MSKPSQNSFYLHAKKSLGQNFLIDSTVVQKIIESVHNFLTTHNKSNPHILEIGPGTGLLTKALLDAANQTYFVTAIEKDQRATKGLTDTLMKQYHDRLVLHEADILKYKPDNCDLCIGNIPYYITSDILMWLCQNKNHFSGVILMVQDEVADRLCAPVNTKDYSRLTIKLQLNFAISKLFRVDKESFVPKPKVNSAVLLLLPKEFKFSTPAEENDFEKFTAFLFSQRRKMLRRIFLETFKTHSPKDVEGFWEKAEEINVLPTHRPESLSPMQVVNLYKLYKN